MTAPRPLWQRILALLALAALIALMLFGGDGTKPAANNFHGESIS